MAIKYHAFGGKDLCFIFRMAVIIPVWIPIRGSQFLYQYNQERRKRKARYPEPLHRRRRNLSRPRPTKSSTLSYAKLSFFDLPREIRDIIYQYVLGGHIVYPLLCRERRLAHFASHPSEPNYPHPYTVDHPSGCARFKKKYSSGKLALVKTCQRLYFEVMEVLYKSNAFAFCGHDGMDDLMAFSQSIRSSRLASIRTLYLHAFKYHRGPRHPEAWLGKSFWTGVWEMIASRMKGLRFVSVRLDLSDCIFYRSGYSELDTNSWVMPMMLVRGLDHFDFVIDVRDIQNLYSHVETRQLQERVERRLRAVTCTPRTNTLAMRGRQFMRERIFHKP